MYIYSYSYTSNFLPDISTNTSFRLLKLNLTKVNSALFSSPQTYFITCISFLLLLLRNHHKLGSLKQHTFTTLQFWRSEALKARCRQGYVPCRGSETECLLAPSACIPWLMAPSCTFRASTVLPSNLSPSLPAFYFCHYIFFSYFPLIKTFMITLNLPT